MLSTRQTQLLPSSELALVSAMIDFTEKTDDA
jgi:hypothetical protein